MATMNPFDLLVDDDNDDPSQLIAAQQQKLAPAAKNTPAPARAATTQQSKPAVAKLPSKPLPPAQAVREVKTESQRGGGRSGGRGRGHGRGSGRGIGRGFDQDSTDKENSFGGDNGFSRGYRTSEDGDSGKPYERRGYGGPRGGFRGGRRGDLSSGEVTEGDRPRRAFERHSGTGRGNDMKREGAGRGNWGTPTDEFALKTNESVLQSEKIIDGEKQLGQESSEDVVKESPEEKEPEEKETEDKEMTLEEYERVLEEKRKALLSLKTEERKVTLDKEFETMQVLSNKKNDDDNFIKLGPEKDKRKEAADKEDKAKKSLNITEFLKPADGESYQRQGGRGRGRGRGSRGYGGSSMMRNVEAPSIEDVGQFPSLSVSSH